MRRLVPLAVISLCIFYSVKWINTNPYYDFPAFYSAGRLLRDRKQPYDLEAQCKLQHQVMPIEGCMPFAHPPLLLPIMAISAVDSLYTSRIIYGSFIWLLFVACSWPLKRLTGSWFKSASLLAFMPVLQALQSTQSTALLLLSVLLWAVLLRDKKDFWAGLVLALALVKPHIAFALAIPLSIIRPKAFLGFLLGGTIVGVYSIALVGVEGIRGMILITRLMAQTEGYYVGRESMYNFAGLLARAHLDTWIVWPAYLIAIVIITLLWKRFGTSIPLLGVAVVITLFFAPHLHLHDLALLILPMTLFRYWVPLIASAVLVLCFGTPWLHIYGYLLCVCVGVASFRQYVMVSYEGELAAVQST